MIFQLISNVRFWLLQRIDKKNQKKINSKKNQGFYAKKGQTKRI